MIVGNFANGNPYTLSGYLDRLIATAVEVPSPPVTPTLSITIPETCCECLGVFGGGINEYQNDYSTLFYKKGSGASDNVVLKLEKDTEIIATITDSTYGTYYDFGTWTTTPQDKYKVLIVDWNSVFGAHGVGVYRIKAEHTGIGGSWDTYSQQFKLQEYSDFSANGTVKFEWKQNGRIRNAEFDYTGMNISQYIRVQGKFGTWNPSLETDEIIYSNYERKQVQDEIINSYTFESRLVDDYISKLLVGDMMLADEIKVTDFNLYNHRKDYINMKLRQDEISVEELPNSDKAVLNLTFTDKFKNQIKQK